MYKITLFDANSMGFVSGVVNFFVDQLEEFEIPWLSISWRNESQRERFRRSKLGEIVTDYYSNDPELNIVQYDEHAKVLTEKNIICQREHILC